METAALARTALMAGRVVVGGGTLVAPRTAGRAFGVDPDDNRAVTYVGRLFGVRALYQVVALATAEDRDRQLRLGVAVDLVDAAAAVAAGRRGDLGRKAATLAGAAALVEAALGCVALSAGRGSPRR